MSAPAPDKLPYGRRRRSAASALVVIVVAFVLGALFNAPAMKRSAMELPFGRERSVRMALIDPLATVSHWLFLDRPARLTAVALGKPDPGPEPLKVVHVGPPPPGGGGGRPGGPPTERPLPRPTKRHPLHLYVAGDSMAGIPGMALSNLARATHQVSTLLDYRISTGLARPDFFNWPAELQQKVKAFHPLAAVVMVGANDNQGVETAKGKVYQFGSSGWEKEYRHRVRDAIAILMDGGARRIYWVGQPVMPKATYDRQIRALNDIYRSEAARVPGVEYVDAHVLFSSGGRYAQFLRSGDGDLQQVREQDGEHFTYAGGLRLAAAVMALVKQDWFPKKPPRAHTASPRPRPSAKASAGVTPAP
jgi:hypothetical protein